MRWNFSAKLEIVWQREGKWTRKYEIDGSRKKHPCHGNQHVRNKSLALLSVIYWRCVWLTLHGCYSTLANPNAIKNQQNRERERVKNGVQLFFSPYIKWNKKENKNFKMNPLSTCLIHHLPIFVKILSAVFFVVSLLFTHLDVSYRPVLSLCIQKPQNPPFNTTTVGMNYNNNTINKFIYMAHLYMWIVMSLWYYEMIRKLFGRFRV